MTIRGIVFDFDQTLAQPHNLGLIRSIAKASFWLRVHHTCDFFRGFRCNDLRKMMNQHLLRYYNQSQGLAFFDKSMAQFFKPHHILPKSLELITLCDQLQLKRAILSDHPCLDKLKAIGLDNGWSAVVSCRNYHALKPLDDAMFALSSQLGIPCSELLFIGDRYDTDAVMAHRSGASFLHVCNISYAYDLIRRT